MTILLLGADGQLGRELLRTLPATGDVVAATRKGCLSDGTRCEVADFEISTSLNTLLRRCRPSVVVNAAAYTAVDRAEREPQVAFRVNVEAPGVIARWCAVHDVPLVHYSTDYVFDGTSDRPYAEDHPTSPLGVYGITKRDGEDAVRAAGGRHLIFRTAWVYAAHSDNFLLTMLRLAASQQTLRVVADQVGTPTPASLIAGVTARALRQPVRHSGTWHLTAAGQTSWHGFAEAIFAEAVATGMIPSAPVVVPIPSAAYPAPAPRPAWSVLDTGRLQREFGEQLPDWREGMRQVLADLRYDFGKGLEVSRR